MKLPRRLPRTDAEIIARGGLMTVSDLAWRLVASGLGVKEHTPEKERAIAILRDYLAGRIVVR